MKRSTPTLQLLVIFALLGIFVSAQTPPFPTAPNSITNITSYTQNNTIGAQINASGGTVNVYNFQSITVNYRWKAYVGNVTGSLALVDANAQSLYNWTITSLTGEVYATRGASSVSWDSILCADSVDINGEEVALNHNVSADDSISNTFNYTTHRTFYAGATQILANSCATTYMNVNNTHQTQYFQEVLLTDGNSFIYASILENNVPGFNNGSYDYQMLVAENGAQGPNPSTAYYFYVELI